MQDSRLREGHENPHLARVQGLLACSPHPPLAAPSLQENPLSLDPAGVVAGAFRGAPGPLERAIRQAAGPSEGAANASEPLRVAAERAFGAAQQLCGRLLPQGEKGQGDCSLGREGTRRATEGHRRDRAEPEGPNHEHPAGRKAGESARAGAIQCPRGSTRSGPGGGQEIGLQKAWAGEGSRIAAKRWARLSEELADPERPRADRGHQKQARGAPQGEQGLLQELRPVVGLQTAQDPGTFPELREEESSDFHEKSVQATSVHDLPPWGPARAFFEGVCEPPRVSRARGKPFGELRRQLPGEPVPPPGVLRGGEADRRVHRRPPDAEPEVLLRARPGHRDRGRGPARAACAQELALLSLLEQQPQVQSLQQDRQVFRPVLAGILKEVIILSGGGGQVGGGGGVRVGGDQDLLMESRTT